MCPRDYKRKEVKSKVALGAGAARGGPGGEGEHCSNERGDSAHTHTRHRTYTRAEDMERSHTLADYYFTILYSYGQDYTNESTWLVRRFWRQERGSLASEKPSCTTGKAPAVW